MADTQSIFDDLAAIMAATSGGRASGRFNEAILNNARDQLANQQFGQQSVNASKQADFKAAQPGLQAGNAVRGDILANGQDATVSGLPDYVQMPNVSGGLRPSMFSGGTREAGGSMARNALTSQLKGGDSIDFPKPPALTPVPQAGALDSILNIGTGAAGAAGLLKKVMDSLKGGGGGGGPLLGGGGGGHDIGSQTTVPEYIDDPGIGTDGVPNSLWWDPTPNVDVTESYQPPGGIGTGEQDATNGLSQDDIDLLMGIGNDPTLDPEEQYAGQNGRYR